MPPKSKVSDIERFMGFVKINKETGCWEWQATKNKSGYGSFKIKCKTKAAHRVSYLYFIGELKSGMHICHKCDNPPCVNPFHLFQGTPKDNQDDAKQKGRMVAAIHPSKTTYGYGCRCIECTRLATKAKLEWTYANGFIKKEKSEYKNRTVKEHEVIEIRRMFDNGSKIKEICLAFPNLQRRHIDDLAKRRKWKWLQ